MKWITVLGAVASVFTILSGICTLCLFLSRKDSDGKKGLPSDSCGGIWKPLRGGSAVFGEREDIPGGNGYPPAVTEEGSQNEDSSCEKNARIGSRPSA